MHLQHETAGLAGRDGSVISKAVTAKDYQNPSLSATEFAATIVAARFRLPISTARLVCELAGIGGLRA